MVGDGATDVEYRPPATAVIGFGKNVVRSPSCETRIGLYTTSKK